MVAEQAPRLQLLNEVTTLLRSPMLVEM